MVSSKEKLIAKKYAGALASVELSSKIIEDLSLIKESFEANEELISSLSNPSVKLESKKSILKEIFSKKIEENSLNTLLLLLEKRRIELAPSLLEFYRADYYKHENVELAEIQTAKKLSNSELSEIKSLLEKSFKKTIEISESSDKSLVAGMKIKIANKVIDSSLKSKLKQLKSILTK